MPGEHREETLTLHSTVHTKDWYYLTDQSDEFQWTSYCDTFKLVMVVGGFFPLTSSAASTPIAGILVLEKVVLGKKLATTDIFSPLDQIFQKTWL